MGFYCFKLYFMHAFYRKRHDFSLVFVGLKKSFTFYSSMYDLSGIDRCQPCMGSGWMHYMLITIKGNILLCIW